MDNVLTVEEMLGLKCPELVVSEVEIETTESSSEIQPNSTGNTKTKEAKKVDSFETGDYKNGARFDELSYCWSQTVNEIGESARKFGNTIILTIEAFQKSTSFCRKIFALQNI